MPMTDDGRYDYSQVQLHSGSLLQQKDTGENQRREAKGLDITTQELRLKVKHLFGQG